MLYVILSALVLSLAALTAWRALASLERSASRLADLSFAPTVEALEELETALLGLTSRTTAFGGDTNDGPCST